MILKFLKHTLILLAVILLQMTVFPNVKFELHNVDIVLVVVIFTAVAYRFYLGVIYAFFLGLFIDIYSPLPFGMNILNYLLVLYAIYVISNKLLTNKSFYSLLGLTLFGTVISNLLFYLFNVSSYFAKTKDYLLIKNFSIISGYDLMWQMLFNSICAIILFFIFNLSSKQFKAVFIDTTKN